MSGRKRIITTAGDKPYLEIVSGGPKKFYNRRRVRKLFINKDVYGYVPIESKWYKSLIEQIVLARRRQGFSQLTLAGKLGTTQPEISRLERGKANPTAEMLDRIFTLLKISVEITSR